MTTFSYRETTPPARLGVIVLQSDETIELDLHAMRRNCEIFVSRVPSGQVVTSASLQAMSDHIGASAALLPETCTMNAVGYGCTSGTAQIGIENIADLIASNCHTDGVTQPLSALVAACAHLNLKRIAILSPYIETVSQTLRDQLHQHGVQTPVFGSFSEAQEAKVVRISPNCLIQAAKSLMQDADVEGLFLSCTNLRTLDVIAQLETDLGKPVLSSNQVLAWHMAQIGNCPDAFAGPGRLFHS